MGKNNFLFPQQSHLEMIKGALAELGAVGAFKPPVTRQEGVWEAEIYSSSGAIFEKATVARVDLCGGLVEEVPTDITLLQAFAWPANPHVPGMIIMASASSTEGADSPCDNFCLASLSCGAYLTGGSIGWVLGWHNYERAITGCLHGKYWWRLG